MRSLSKKGRLLPVTMTVISLLFAEKAVGIAREVTSSNQSQISASAVGDTPSTKETRATVSPSAAPAPTVTPAELQVLQDLRERRRALDERERQLDQRAELLASVSMKLQTKLDELTSLQHNLEQLEQAKHARENANWRGLVETYEDMKAQDAAAIFNVLDISVLLEVLDRMEERKAAAVLAAMMPERARLATQMLAQRRLRQETLPPSDAQTASNPEPRG